MNGHSHTNYLDTKPIPTLLTKTNFEVSFAAWPSLREREWWVSEQGQKRSYSLCLRNMDMHICSITYTYTYIHIFMFMYVYIHIRTYHIYRPHEKCV